MKGFRKATWAMLVWTVLCGLITVLWLSASVTEKSALTVGKAVKVDKTFQVTLTSTTPPAVKIDNLTTKNATFWYSNVKMIDSTGTEHEPSFNTGVVDKVPASGSISKTLDYGNIGNSTPASYHWACTACAAGEAIGKAIVFVMMGGIYWFGMLILFIIWLVTRPPRVVTAVQ